jgi:hypothetical protein
MGPARPPSIILLGVCGGSIHTIRYPSRVVMFSQQLVTGLTNCCNHSALSVFLVGLLGIRIKALSMGRGGGRRGGSGIESRGKSWADTHNKLIEFWQEDVNEEITAWQLALGRVLN